MTKQDTGKLNAFSDEDGVALVRKARNAVEEYLKTNMTIELPQELRSKFDFDCGVFVTIYKKNPREELRGCIGVPVPQKRLYQALVESAISSATEDPRFSPVSIEELDRVCFEVTVLTPPQEIKVDSPTEYPAKIKVGRDGLLVRTPQGSGLLLPQVPLEFGWDEYQFLNHTCQKAGAPSDSWQDPDTRVWKFEGILFKEVEPKGEIIRQENYGK